MVEWKGEENHHLVEARCCGNCAYSIPDYDSSLGCFCEHSNGPSGMLLKTTVCDLFKSSQ